MKFTLQKIIYHALKKLKIKAQQNLICLEHPSDSRFGDYSSNIALQIFSQSQKKGSKYQNPMNLAEAIAAAIQAQLALNDSQLKKLQSQIKTITAVKPGFINFTFTDEYLLATLQLAMKDNWPSLSTINQGKKVIVEYSSPNIAKPFTIGHLRSTIIGDAIANLLQATGWQVYRDNHLGDWGTQFGKQIMALKTWGDEKVLDQSKNPVKDLVALYVKFHQEAEKDATLEDQGRAWFKKLEAGDPEARRLWQKCIDWSWKEFNIIYQKLGIKFTENQGRGYGESFFEDKMPAIIEELKNKKLLTSSQGAQMVFFPDDQYPPIMIIKKDGATLYVTRDLATDKFRLSKYGSDILIINEVGAEQELYFKQLFALEKMLAWIKEGQRIHVKHGMYRFKDQKMSTRKGNVIWLQDVLQEAYQRVAKVAQDRIDEASLWAIAMGALKWNDLKKKAELNVLFDWDEVTKIEGNSGPYLQYTYTRCQSVLSKAKTKSVIDQFQTTDFKKQKLNTEERLLIQLLNQFIETVVKAAEQLAPHHLCSYLYQLAQAYNSFYSKHSILQAESAKSIQLRLGLTQITALVMKQGLALLGIKVVNKM